MSFEFEVEIRRPKEEVFDFLATPSNGPRWIRGAVPKGVLPDRAAVGLCWQNTLRQFGRTFPVSLQCTHFEPPDRIGVRTLEPFRSAQVMTLRASDSGTAVHVQGGGDVGAFFNAARPLLALYFRRIFRADFERLKAVLEAESRVPVQGAVTA
ncbi:MAG: SRPBCC family protein [Candidatus Dormibacteria bacterium]